MNSTNYPQAKTPREIADRVAEHLRAGDLEGVLTMFHPECMIFFPPDEPAQVGTDGAREVFKDFVPQRPVLKSTILSEVINGDTALLQAEWQFLSHDGSVMAEGKSTEVAKLLPEGGWVYYIDCPLGPPMIAREIKKTSTF